MNSDAYLGYQKEVFDRQTVELSYQNKTTSLIVSSFPIFFDASFFKFS